jgi:hypothetical protein
MPGWQVFAKFNLTMPRQVIWNIPDAAKGLVSPFTASGNTEYHKIKWTKIIHAVDDFRPFGG